MPSRRLFFSQQLLQIRGYFCYRRLPQVHRVTFSLDRCCSLCPYSDRSSGNRCGCARRGSLCAQARSSPRLRRRATWIARSFAMCHPGLNMREPSTRTFAGARFQLFKLAERLLQVFFHAENADQRLHRLLQITVNFVRDSRRRRARTAPASRVRRLATWRRQSSAAAVLLRVFGGGHVRRGVRRRARSESEFPPRRFAPCNPAAASPAAKSPGTVDAAVSASTLIPPIM